MANGKRFRWLKWLVTLLLIGGVVGGGYYWYQQRRAAENGSPYQTAAITRGDLTQVVTATGQINPVLNVQVGSQISGIIQKLFVDFNSTVTNGQIIAQIDPATYHANVEQGMADLANAKAQLELATVNARRSRELLDSRLIPQSDYDQVVAALHQAEAQVAIKNASLQRSQTDLDRCTIYSPIDGIVIDRKVDVGQTVAASLSAPTLYVIANDLRNMQIDANVAEADIGLAAVGLPVSFTVDAYPYQTFRGEVVQVRNAPITVQNVVTYDTIVKVNNDELKLKPGMTANTSIIIAERKDVLRIANAAFRVKLPKDVKKDTTVEADTREPVRKHGRSPQRQDQPVSRTIYILSRRADGTLDQTPKPVKVKTGISDGAFTQLIEGLKEGDEVITFIKPSDKAASPTSSPLSGGMRFR